MSPPGFGKVADATSSSEKPAGTDAVVLGDADGDDALGEAEGDDALGDGLEVSEAEEDRVGIGVGDGSPVQPDTVSASTEAARMPVALVVRNGPM
jgi:hypothetical protein